MAQTSNPPSSELSGSFIDPDSVPEIICDGPFHILPGSLSTITFTHGRPETSQLFNQNSVNRENIVRARIILTIDNLIQLRDLLNRLLPASTETPAATGGTSRPVVH
jgi:hypothetical protein